MMWLISLVVSIIIICVAINLLDRRSTEDLGNFFMTIGVISLTISSMVTLILLFSGLLTYPYLVGQKEEIISLRANAKNIRNAKYSYKTDGKLVAGSIENFKQSTIHSNYYAKLAKKEANYNSVLVSGQLYEGNTLYFYVWKGMFINSDIQKLKKIKYGNNK